MPSLIHRADQNIKYYILVRIFAKRVFLPLTAIYFIDTAGLTIRDIGFLSAYFSAIQLFAEVPTGYFADRIGRTVSLRIGTILAMIATTLYVLFQNRTGIYIGVCLEALGYSFMGGAGEALIHDSLVVKKQTSQYTKIMSNNMAISLIANAILVAGASSLYTIDPRAPFALGTLAYAILLIITYYLTDIYPPKPKVTSYKFPQLTNIVTHKSMLVFGLTFGLVSALYTSPNDMLNVALREYGIRVDHIGWIFALGSLLGAILGPFNHLLRKLPPNLYVLLDSAILTSLYAAAFSRSPYILAIVMIFAISFWRYRRIIYQDYLLRIYPNSYKATLVSTLNNLDQLNAIWLPIAITTAIHHLGMSRGFGLIGIFTILVIPIFYSSSVRYLVRKLG